MQTLTYAPLLSCRLSRISTCTLVGRKKAITGHRAIRRTGVVTTSRQMPHYLCDEKKNTLNGLTFRSSDANPALILSVVYDIVLDVHGNVTGER